MRLSLIFVGVVGVDGIFEKWFGRGGSVQPEKPAPVPVAKPESESISSRIYKGFQSMWNGDFFRGDARIVPTDDQLTDTDSDRDSEISEVEGHPERIRIAKLLRITNGDAFSPSVKTRHRNVVSSTYSEPHVFVKDVELLPVVSAWPLGAKRIIAQSGSLEQGERLLVDKEAACQLDLLSHPLHDQLPAGEDEKKGKDNINHDYPSTKLLKCLSARSEVLTTLDLQLKASGIQIHKDVVRHPYLDDSDASTEVRQNCERIMLILAAEQDFDYMQGEIEVCFYLGRRKGVKKGEAFLETRKFLNDITRVVLFERTVFDLYVAWLAEYWRLALSAHFNKYLPTIESSHLMQGLWVFLLRPTTRLGEVSSDILPQMDSLWDFLLTQGRAGLFALYIATLSTSFQQYKSFDESCKEIFTAFNDANMRPEERIKISSKHQRHFRTNKWQNGPEKPATGEVRTDPSFKDCDNSMDLEDMVSKLIQTPWEYIFDPSKVQDVVQLSREFLNLEINGKPFSQMVEDIDQLTENRVQESLRRAYTQDSHPVSIIPGVWSIANQVEANVQDQECHGPQHDSPLLTWTLSREVTAVVHRRLSQVSSKREIPHDSSLVHVHNPWTVYVGLRKIELRQESFYLLARSFKEQLDACVNWKPFELLVDRDTCILPALPQFTDTSSESLLTCLSKHIGGLISAKQSHYQALLRIHNEAQRFPSSKAVADCESALGILHVVVLNAPDAFGSGHGLAWCLGIWAHVNDLAIEPEMNKLLKKNLLNENEELKYGLIEAMLVLSNGILRSTRFGIPKADAYLHVLANFWASATSSLFGGFGSEMINPVDLTVDTHYVEYIVEQLRALVRDSLPEYTMEYWKFLFSEGRAGLMALLVAKLEHKFQGQRAVEKDQVLQRAMEIIEMKNIPNVASFRSLVEAIDFMVDDIVLNSISP